MTKKCSQLPQSSTTDADRHWAAGLFEGEGTVSIAVRNSDETFRLICIVGNTDNDVVEFFQTRWPSWKTPFYGERPGRKPGWTWTCAGPRAEAFIREIRPFIRTERVRKKIDLGLRFREVQATHASTHRGGHLSDKAAQRALYFELKELNRRGRKPGDITQLEANAS